MIRFAFLLVFLLALGAQTTGVVEIAGPSAGYAQAAVTPPPPPAVDATAGQMPVSLPERNALALSNRAYLHVFLSFGLTWLLLLAYLVSIGRRFTQLEEEVRRLRRTV